MGPQYTVVSGGLYSFERGRIEISGLSWKYWDGSKWADDETLKVEGNGIFSDAK